MMSDSRPEDRKNSGDNIFRGIPVAGDEAVLFAQFLDAHDLAQNSRRAFAQDVRKFAQWFTTANREPLCMTRVTVRDITDFREHLRRDQGQAVATVNRAIVTVRKDGLHLMPRLSDRAPGSGATPAPRDSATPV